MLSGRLALRLQRICMHWQTSYFIKYDLKQSAFDELEDGRFLEGFAEHSLTPYMFKDYMLKHQQTMHIIKTNSTTVERYGKFNK